VIVADESKLVGRLGELQPIPVEIVRFGWRQTAARLANLGCTPELRFDGAEPFVTDEGHYILDCRFSPLDAPEAAASQIKAIVGVVEHGLFLGLADRIILAGEDGVREFRRGLQRADSYDRVSRDRGQSNSNPAAGSD
jgi:ribose 5-phosphate isomerase A